MTYDPTKPTMVVLRSLPRSGSHMATNAINAWLESRYEDTMHVYPYEFFELNGGRQLNCHVEMDAHGNIIEASREPLQDEHDHRRRLLVQAINRGKSFSFKTFAMESDKSYVVRFLERYAKDRGYNVIKIDLFRRDIFQYYLSRVYAQTNKKWVYVEGEDHRINQVNTPQHMLSKWAIEYHILFDVLRYYNNPDRYEHVVCYEDLVDKGCEHLIHMWDKDADMSTYKNPHIKTPVKYEDVVVEYEQIKQHFIDTLGYYNVPHDNFKIDPDYCPFDIDMDIPGWTSFAKLFALGKYAYKVPRNLAILECGSYVGRSSYVLGMNKKRQVPLYCLDWFPDGKKAVGAHDSILGAEEHMDKLYSFETFLGFMRKVPEMYPFRGDLFKRIGMIQDRSIYLAFVDAGHSYEDTIMTLRAVKPKMDPAYSIIAIDDYNENRFPESKKAIDEFIKENPPFAMEQCPGDSTMIILRYKATY